MIVKLTTAIVILLASIASASAQQSPQQQPAPSVQDQLVAVYVNLNTSLAKQLDTANAQIADLTKKLADETAKCEAKKTEPRK